MPDNQIIFNPDQKDYSAGLPRKGKVSEGRLTDWLINYSGGLIKSDKLANVILILIVFVCLLAAVVILINTFG